MLEQRKFRRRFPGRQIPTAQTLRLWTRTLKSIRPQEPLPRVAGSIASVLLGISPLCPKNASNRWKHRSDAEKHAINHELVVPKVNIGQKPAHVPIQS
ncbi:unnamed protein product [Danaus chrysippus]|uniref:(African queen) hypothetical protein n=1 Tax=Danaus chrysippus TaxID=151541 RepID=A0A8J2R2R2_9NEOP|nr:unnamed protein product [Danaus chrysippus]